MTYLMQALNFFSAIKKSFPQFVTVSHRVGGDLHALSHTDVLFCHPCGGVPKLVSSFSDAPC
jgi:hypothetical protein